MAHPIKTSPFSSRHRVTFLLVHNFVEYLKSKKGRKEEDSQWSRFSLDSAMRGIEAEPSPYGIHDIKEKFS
ncbi:MAG TPA: hypothetical protein VKA69_05525 [Desulfobacteria bacterium]|nr:hypothetical protein [Desulfobacteria bacterium]